MSSSAHVQSIQALEDLKGALGRFSGEAQEALGAAEQEIRRTLDWLHERLNHWQNEVRRRQEEVRQAMDALLRCQASGYHDRDGHYHAPDCSAYERALRQAQARLQEAEAELANVRRWAAQVQQATAAYQAQERRLQEVTTTQSERAQASLERAITDLERYLTVAPPPVASMVTSSAPTPSTFADPATRGFTWTERMAIVKRTEAGQPITPEELQRLRAPITDLQEGTLAEDESWLNQLLESDRYAETMRDSREAADLRDAVLATMEAINYWRSKP